MAVTYRKDGRWAVYCKVHGRLKWEYFGAGAEGERAAYQRDAELAQERRGRKRRPAGPLVLDLARAYLKGKTDLNDNSRRTLTYKLEANLLPHFGAKVASRLQDQDLDSYCAKRRADGVKNSTIARELTDLKAILNWSVKRKPPLVPFNPVRDYKKPPSDDEIILPPTREETRRILKFAKPHLRRIILLSYYTGLRPGAVELLSMR